MTAPFWITAEQTFGPYTEGDSILENLSFNPGTGATVSLISGSFPSGVTLVQLNATTAQITGTIGYIDESTIFVPCVRVQNQFGAEDRAFSIDVQNIVPTWTQLQALGSYPELSFVQITFTLNDPGGTPVFTKISGTLPPGLTLHSSGVLAGSLNSVDADTTYTFTVQAETGNTTLSRTFTLTVQDVSSASSIPIFITSSGVIGEVQNGEYFSYQIQAVDLDGDPLTFSISAGALPTGLSMSGTGLITGTLNESAQSEFAFQVQIADGSSPVQTRTFSIRTNQSNAAAIDFVLTPEEILSGTPGNLGSISVGTPCTISIRAESTRLLEYMIVAGSLPDGLTLTEQGDIVGRVNYQTPGIFTFTVRSRNLQVQTDKVYTLTVTANLSQLTIKGWINLPLQHKEKYRQILTSSILNAGTVYRESDPEFGRRVDPEIVLVYNNLNKKTELQNFLSGREELQILLSEFKLGTAYRSGTPLYDVIYRDVIDINDTLEESVLMPGGQTVYPTSLGILRSILTGSISGTEPLPEFMTSEQIQGDPSSVLGYKPVMVVCYLEPSELNREILTELNNAAVLGESLYGTRIRLSDIRFDYLVQDQNGFTVRFHNHV